MHNNDLWQLLYYCSYRDCTSNLAPNEISGLPWTPVSSVSKQKGIYLPISDRNQEVLQLTSLQPYFYTQACICKYPLQQQLIFLHTSVQEQDCNKRNVWVESAADIHDIAHQINSDCWTFLDFSPNTAFIIWMFFPHCLYCSVVLLHMFLITFFKHTLNTLFSLLRSERHYHNQKLCWEQVQRTVVLSRYFCFPCQSLFSHISSYGKIECYQTKLYKPMCLQSEIQKSHTVSSVQANNLVPDCIYLIRFFSFHIFLL